MPMKLSALKDLLIAALHKSLYLSSHNLEMAWESQSKRTQEQIFKKRSNLGQKNPPKPKSLTDKSHSHTPSHSSVTAPLDCGGLHSQILGMLLSDNSLR